GVTPPRREDGPHLAAFTVGCRALGRLADLPLTRAGNRQVLAPKKNFGTAIGFIELKRESLPAAWMSAFGHEWTAPWQDVSDAAAALVGCGDVSGLFVRRSSRWP